MGYFSDCSLFDSADEFVRGLEPEFYDMGGTAVARLQEPGRGVYRQREVSIFLESLENSVGFQFRKLPVIL